LPLPDVRPGELVAVPVSGAYQLSMANHYNGACQPAVLWLEEGHARLVLQREEASDLIRRDQPI
jgi:diaminopimelate decarboxylase